MTTCIRDQLHHCDCGFFRVLACLVQHGYGILHDKHQVMTAYCWIWLCIVLSCTMVKACCELQDHDFFIDAKSSSMQLPMAVSQVVKTLEPALELKDAHRHCGQYLRGTKCTWPLYIFRTDFNICLMPLPVYHILVICHCSAKLLHSVQLIHC